MRMRANWQRLIQAPALSTFAPHSISTPSSSGVLKTTLVVIWCWFTILLRHGWYHAALLRTWGRCEWIRPDPLFPASIPPPPLTLTFPIDPFVPTTTLPSSPTLASHYVSLGLLLYLAVASVYCPKLHLIPFWLTISSHWNFFFSSRSFMVKKSGLQLTDLTMSVWSKILWDEDGA